MQTRYENLKPYLEKRKMLEASLTLFQWDLETLAPEQAVERTATVVALLEDALREAILEPEVRNTIEALDGAPDLTPEQAAVIRVLREDLERLEKIPAEEYRTYANLRAIATSVWAKARAERDFSQFAPVLERMLNATRRFAALRAKPGQEPYDVLLEDYEKGFPMKELDRFFDQLQRELPALVRQAVEAQREWDDRFLHQPYSLDKQREFNRYLAEYMGLTPQRVVLGESAHPFTTGLHRDDVRITNHFYENLPISAIFSTIHEGGHALYELGVAPELTMTPVGGGASCGMHESQSRFYENMLGRRREFWVPLYGKMQSLFPEQMGAAPLEQFIQGINRVEPSLIRTEADEVTYSLHVLVRYRAERELMDGSLPVRDLPERWNSLYEEVLGVRPRHDGEGVLQDIHWAQGSFGYFPSYALGNAFAAQISRRLEQELPVGELLEQGKLAEITHWLGEKIHRFGAVKPVRLLLEEVCGQPFSTDAYLSYLRAKVEGFQGASKKPETML